MNNYVDINNNWNFTSTGDLKLNKDYIQSVKNRFLCNKEHLKIYYDDYGSDLKNLIGKGYDRDEALFILNNTLSQDENITSYTIDNLTYNKGVLIVYLTIDGVTVEIEINTEELL